MPTSDPMAAYGPEEPESAMFMWCAFVRERTPLLSLVYVFSRHPGETAIHCFQWLCRGDKYIVFSGRQGIQTGCLDAVSHGLIRHGGTIRADKHRMNSIASFLAHRIVGANIASEAREL